MPPPSPAPAARTGPPAARPAAPKARLRWTWLEWFLIAQTFIPAFLFVRGISSGRVVIRIAVFFLALATWAAVIWTGRARGGVLSTYSPNLPLKWAAGWLLLSILHWDTSTPQAGLAQALLYIAVLSPSFWAPSLLSSPRQVGRLMAILLLCNGASALVGLGQVFRPATFNPPVIHSVTDVAEDEISAQALTYTDDHGNKIIRPCGLSDSPGGASGPGGVAVMIGLACALRPVGPFRRLICVALAFAGMAVIYYSQVRMVLVMLVVCLAVLTVTFVLQKNFGYATVLSGLGVAMIVGAFSWVAATSGLSVVSRFLTLTTKSFAENYEASYRGGFVLHAFEVLMPEGPLGHGLGRWGTIYQVFGDPHPGKSIWVEVMIPAWIVDGGIPLLVLYGVAIALAMASTFRVALRSRDRDLRFWAAVVFASNLSVIATCFSYVTFITTIGMQFWFLAAVIHAADYRNRQAAARAGRPAPAPAAAPTPRGWPPAPVPHPTAPA